MADKIVKRISELAQVNRALNWLDGMICKGLESGTVEVTIGRPAPVRSGEANKKLHAMIGDIHEQAVIAIPGRRIVMLDYDIEQCKALLVIWFANERAIAGDPLAKPPRNFRCPITGENISIRPSTTEWSKRDTGEFIEFLYATGSAAGVKWSEKALECYQSYREAQS